MDYWWPCLATSLAATESAAAEEPESTPNEALAQLAIAGAPLIGAPAGPAAQATDKTSLSTTPGTASATRLNAGFDGAVAASCPSGGAPGRSAYPGSN